MDVEDVVLGSGEYSVRVMGLVSFLLHYNASNLVLEILKHDKVWMTICISVPPLLILRTRPPVIYARDHDHHHHNQHYLARSASTPKLCRCYFRILTVPLVTNHLRMYWTDLHQIFRIGIILYVGSDKHVEPMLVATYHPT